MSREHVPDEPARNNMLGENTPDREEEPCSKCGGRGKINRSSFLYRWEECDRCNGTGEEPTE